MIAGKSRWIYLAVGTLLLLLVGLIYAWSIFRGPLSELFPDWTATQISTIFMISIIAFCSFGLLSGKLSEKMKSAVVIRIASLLLLVGFGTISLLLTVESSSKSLLVMNIFYGLLCGGGVGFVYNSVIGTVTKWFPNDTGMASGVLLMGFGIGGIVLGSVVNVLAEAVGIQKTFVIIGGIIAVLLFAGSFFIKNPPWWDEESSEKKGEGKTDSGNVPNINSVKSFRFSEMIKTPTAWICFLFFVALGAGGMIIINSAAVIAVYFGASAVMGLIVSVFNGAGRVIFGKAYDKLGRLFSQYVTCAIMILAGTSLLLGSLLNSLVFIFIGLPLMGIAFGATPSLVAGMAHGFFGPKYFSVNYSFMTLNLAPSAILGPILSSKLQDASNGSFEGTFIMLIVMGFVALILAMCISWSAKRDGLLDGSKK